MAAVINRSIIRNSQTEFNKALDEFFGTMREQRDPIDDWFDIIELSSMSLFKPVDGLTAFEVTEETLRKRKVTDFRDKIRRYNANNSQKIQGGVLLIDQKISPSMMTFMKNERVWGWGNGRQSLYKARLGVFNAWKEIGLTSEIALDENTSFLRCSTPPPTTSDKLLRFAVFFDNDFIKLSLRKVTEILGKIRENSISPLMSIGVSPINIHLEFHSVGGVSISEQDFEEHLVKSWRTEEINIMGKCVFSDYRTFPSM